MISIPAFRILDALASVRRVVDTKNPNAALQLARIKVGPTSLTIVGSSGTKSVEVVVEAEAGIADCRTFLVDPHRLHDLIKNSGGTEFQATVADECIKVSCGRTKAKVATTDADTYPAPYAEETPQFTMVLPAQEFATALKAVERFVGARDGGATGFGLLVDSVTDGVRLVSAEPPVLAMASIKPEVTGTIPVDVSLTYETVDMRAKEIGGVEEPITVTMTKRALMLHMSGTTLHARLMEQAFPDYRMFLTALPEKCIHVDREELVAALKALLGSGDAELCGVKGGCRFTPGGEGVTLYSTTSNGAGDVSASLSASVEGDVEPFGVSGAKLLAICTSTTGDRLSIHTRGPLHPAMICVDGALSYVIMPIRLDGKAGSSS